MAKNSSWLARIFLVAAVVAMAVTVAEGLTCGTVSGKLAPCITYARSNGATPPSGNCCNGIKGLNSLAATPKDRKDACACLKNAANSVKGINLKLIEGLPNKCGVNIPYKLSPSTDCNTIN